MKIYNKKKENQFMKIYKIFFIVLLTFIFTFGCQVNVAEEDETNTDTTVPTVSFTLPANNATNVATNANITATFSEEMNPVSFTASTFTLSLGATPISGVLAYTYVDGVSTETLNPAIDLTADTTYDVTITTGVTDLSGNALAVNKVWSFKTGLAPDTTPPTVISTLPDNLATYVAVTENITATFSEVMNPATITTASFSLKTGLTPVTCALTYIEGGVVAYLNPASNLLADTTYDATITIVARDLADNPLAVNKTWSFKTASAAGIGPAPVLLGTAGNYVILTETGITSVPLSGTDIQGDMGVYPIGYAAITGFSMTNVGTYWTSALVNGKIYASDNDEPTPTALNIAINDKLTAYNDAAGRLLPDFTNLYTGELGGHTLVPGLYKYTSAVTISQDVTLDGGANDVWIFQISGTLDIAAGKKVLLPGGALPKNIFWQTAGNVTFQGTSHFEGVLLSAGTITLITGATANGRLLGKYFVALDGNVVTKPAP